MGKIKCIRCGAGGFRYRRTDRISYCLSCGYEVTEEFWEKFRNKEAKKE